eukprot:3380037-Rhodomonas_salina.1
MSTPRTAAVNPMPSLRSSFQPPALLARFPFPPRPSFLPSHSLRWSSLPCAPSIETTPDLVQGTQVEAQPEYAFGAFGGRYIPETL